MKRQKKETKPGEDLFVGIDIHKRTWHVTVQTGDIELFCGSIPGKWEALNRLLNRFKGYKITVV
ncbi:hypothetical protein ACFL6W_05545 [Thermodesulfobacteriota bacterium]